MTKLDDTAQTLHLIATLQHLKVSIFGISKVSTSASHSISHSTAKSHHTAQTLSLSSSASQKSQLTSQLLRNFSISKSQLTSQLLRNFSISSINLTLYHNESKSHSSSSHLKVSTPASHRSISLSI